MSDYRKLKVYEKAFANAMEIFHMTKSFPKEEKYALIDQIRRSSRSVCSNIAEGYRKRKYKKHFVAKLTDSDMENSETLVWLEFALACEYINKSIFEDFQKKNKEVGKLLGYMLKHPDKFI